MISFDSDNLTKLLYELEPKRRTQAVKGAFRKAANEVKKQMVANIKASGLNTDSGVTKGVRRILYRKTAGFRVTVGTKRANKNGKGEQGYHQNRQGLRKPVLMWADIGTKQRKTRGRRGKGSRLLISRNGHSTGQMKRYGFVGKTARQMEGRVTEDLRKAMDESIRRTAKKYGCKT